MKNFKLPFLMIILLLFFLTGCNPASSSISFTAQYIRTNGYYEVREYPITSVITKTSELTAYYEKYKDEFDFERRQQIASDSTKGFLDAVEKYNDAYFKDNILLMILAEESSGSNRHKVTGISSEDGVLYIQVERLIPQVGTSDMAQWHILVEIDQDNWKDQEIRVQFSEKRP